MAVTQNQIACDAWLYSEGLTTLAGSNSYACPPKSVITNTYGLTVNGSYTDTQLVKQSDISAGLAEIPFYVIFNFHTVPYSSRWVYYQGRNVMPIYCNVKTDVGITVEHNSTSGNITDGSHVNVYTNGNTGNITPYDIYMNTSLNRQGSFQALPSDSSSGTIEWCMNMDNYSYSSPSYNKFAIPQGSTIKGITVKGLYVTFYDASNNSIGTSGSVSTNFAYSLKLAKNTWGRWDPLTTNWTDQYNSTITSSMVGYSTWYILDAPSVEANASDLSGSNRGIAIMFDFHDLYGGSSGGNSSW